MDTSMEVLVCVIDKEFSLTADYPKDHGDLFKTWMDLYYSGVLLLHCVKLLDAARIFLLKVRVLFTGIENTG